ncbi:MAG: Hsp20/alpha crystallin family protein [Taibaiella sp.]|nr:Hsp20/alpha crystallin family protein [Taibaiella sp.]
MYTKRSYGILPETVNGLMEDLFFKGMHKVNDEAALYQVPVNIRETDGSYELHVIAPGLKKEDFRLAVEKNMLTISFAHREENKEQANDGKWLRSEHKMRSFKRNFTMNEKVETTGITAKYADGILLVTLPKKEVSEPTKQEIVIN